MDTEQAHSPGGTSFGSSAGLREQTPSRREVATAATRAVPATWLNLVCLDAPLVSVVWLWLFARTFQLPVAPAYFATLFLTAWLIYLADRLADSYSLRGEGPRSLRHTFCLNYRQIWVAGLAVIAIIDALLISRGISLEVLFYGAVIGLLALLHLVINYSSGGAWPRLPLKELAVGFLFVAGTLVALFPSLPLVTGSFVFSGIAFGWLCTLNCISIAFWERELDERQGKVSFATRYPFFDRHLGMASIVLALISAVMAISNREVAPIFGCVTMSACLLALLEALRRRIDRDQRTALADLVLLTPLLALLIANA